jgi:hypothetical protein
VAQSATTLPCHSLRWTGEDPRRSTVARSQIIIRPRRPRSRGHAGRHDPSASRLLSDRVSCRLTTTLTIVEPVFTEPDVELSLAKYAVFLALAASFDLFTLIASDLVFRRHGETLTLRSPARERSVGNHDEIPTYGAILGLGSVRFELRTSALSLILSCHPEQSEGPVQ